MPKKRSIEELLEAFAKKRRDALGSELKMPNPMRSRLQEEVAKQYREETAPASKPSWFAGWCPWIAFAVATLVLITIPVWHQFQTAPVASDRLVSRAMASNSPPSSAQRQQLLALLREQPSQNAVSPAPAPAPAGASPEDSGQQTADAASSGPAGKLRIDSAESSLALNAPPPKALTGPNLDLAKSEATPPAAQVGSPLLAKRSSSPTPLDFGKAPVIAQAKTMAAPEERKAAPAPAQTGPLPLASVSVQRFLNSAPSQFAGGGETAGNALANNKDAPSRSAFYGQLEAKQANRRSTQNILNTFDFEQTGNRVRVVDTDGSTYTGEIQPEVRQPQQGILGKASSLAGNANSQNSNSEQSLNLRFRATGPNITLKKPLVLEATCIMPPIEQQQLQQQNSQLKNQLQAIPSRIVGVARISGEPEIEVDAAPVSK